MTDLQQILETPRIVVFLDWSWSNQAAQGRKLIAQLRGVPLLVVNLDDDTLVASWVTDECGRSGKPLHGGGFGSLLFVRAGAVEDWVERVNEHTLESLQARIDNFAAAN